MRYKFSVLCEFVLEGTSIDDLRLSKSLIEEWLYSHCITCDGNVTDAEVM